MTAVALVIESSVRALVIAAAVGAVLWGLRVRASRVRHSAWVAVVLTMLLMPALIAVVPSVSVPLPFAPAVSEVALPQLGPRISTFVSTDAASVAPLVPAASPLPAAATVNVPAAPPPSPSQPLDWTAIAAVVYGVVAAWFMLRIVVGWLAARRLLRRSVRLFADVRESADVSVPVSVGVFRRSILLPRSWREWSEEQTNIVLAHERSHVRRRDVLTSMLASLNRACFWFHPLAWWLERHLAAAAEHVADDEAVRRAGSREAYARTLIDVAAAMRAHGGRVSWQGVGMAGGSRLTKRIDRILAGSAADSRLRRRLAAACCAMAIVAGIACRQALTPPAPLVPDPDVTAEIEASRNDTQLYREVWRLTREQIAELEGKWRQAPGDLDLARRLLIAYQPLRDGKWAPDAPSYVPARRELILWLIKNHPDISLVRRYSLTPRPTNGLPDPAGFAQARALWLAHLENPNLTPRALSNAAAFFWTTEPERTEQILLRAQRVDPGGGGWREGNASYSGTWSSELGALYAGAIGHVVRGEGNVPRIDRAAPSSAFAQHSRAVLDQSKDAAMLSRAGELLAYLRGENLDSVLGFDPIALGRQYVERAAALQPDNPDLRRRSRALAARGSDRPMFASAGATATPEALIDDAVAGRRYWALTGALQSAYFRGEMVDYYKRLPDSSALGQRYASVSAEEHWARTRQLADRIIEIAGRVRDDANFGAAMADAHQALGLLALRAGDGELATQHLLMSGDAPRSDELLMSFRPFESRLTSTLLKYGVREPVAQYYDKMAKAGVAADVNTKNAAAIRAGTMPRFYQLLLAREQQSLEADSAPPKTK